MYALVHVWRRSGGEQEKKMNANSMKLLFTSHVRICSYDWLLDEAQCPSV